MKTFASANSHPIKHTVKILTALLLVSPHFAAGKNQSKTNYLEDFSQNQFRQPKKTEILAGTIQLSVPFRVVVPFMLAGSQLHGSWGTR